MSKKFKIQIPPINEERLLRSINHSVESIIKSNNLISENLGGIKSIIIQKTSLDLLFIMDLTGSMEQFVEKKN